MVVKAHCIDPVNVLLNRRRRVRSVIGSEKVGGKVDRCREEEPAAVGGGRILHKRGAPLFKKEPKVVHILLALWEFPVEIESIKPILPSCVDGGVDEGRPVRRSADHLRAGGGSSCAASDGQKRFRRWFLSVEGGGEVGEEFIILLIDGYPISGRIEQGEGIVDMGEVGGVDGRRREGR